MSCASAARLPSCLVRVRARATVGLQGQRQGQGQDQGQGQGQGSLVRVRVRLRVRLRDIRVIRVVSGLQLPEPVRGVVGQLVGEHAQRGLPVIVDLNRVRVKVR